MSIIPSQSVRHEFFVFRFTLRMIKGVYLLSAKYLEVSDKAASLKFKHHMSTLVARTRL